MCKSRLFNVPLRLSIIYLIFSAISLMIPWVGLSSRALLTPATLSSGRVGNRCRRFLSPWFAIQCKLPQSVRQVRRNHHHHHRMDTAAGTRVGSLKNISSILAKGTWNRRSHTNPGGHLDYAKQRNSASCSRMRKSVTSS